MRFFTLLNAFLLTLIVLGLFGVARNIVGIKNTKKRLLVAEEQVIKLEDKRGELYFDLENKKSREYLEKEIRNKLKMVKQGESLVVLPKELGEKSEDDTYKYGIGGSENPEKEKNYRKWLNLLSFAII